MWTAAAGFVSAMSPVAMTDASVYQMRTVPTVGWECSGANGSAGACVAQCNGKANGFFLQRK